MKDKSLALARFLERPLHGWPYYDKLQRGERVQLDALAMKSLSTDIDVSHAHYKFSRYPGIHAREDSSARMIAEINQLSIKKCLQCMGKEVLIIPALQPLQATYTTRR
jgi:hypothetical protein